MSFELYNKSNKIKELPKYNYNGKFKLKPQQTYGIKDYMVAFYKPYAKVGVIVRRSVSDDVLDVEPEVKKILEESEKKPEPTPVVESSIEDKTVEVTAEETEDKDRVSVETVKEVEDINKAPEVETEKEDVKKYTEEEIKGMKINDIKSILDDMNIDYSSVPYKKDAYVKALLDAQEV